MAKDPSKTEHPTQKRINKARREGNVPKSQEVSKVVTMIAGMMVLSFWISYMAGELMGLYRHFLNVKRDFNAIDSNIINLGFWLAQEVAKLVLPVALFLALMAFVIVRWQVGKLWTTKPLQPKLSKFNPIAGFKRMLFSTQTFVRLGKNIIQAIVIGLAPWFVIRKEMDSIIGLYNTDAMSVAVYMLEMGYTISLYALIPMLAIAAFDYWYTNHDYIENLKMTKDEIKDERRQAEGDPKMKQAMKQKMMALGMNRMMADVKRADVIITNPTHIAVALRYDAKEFPAPVILAMGANKVAERIKEIAKEHHIPIRENKPLARALYKQSQVGDMIPADLFQAVAAVLAQIWKTRQNAQQSAGGPGQ